MREILKPPVYDQESLPELIKLIDELDESFEEYDLLDRFDDRRHELRKIIKEKSQKINQLTQKEIDPIRFKGYSAHSSTKQMAEEALMPEPPKVPNMTLEELIEIIELFSNPEIITGNYVEYYLELLEKSFSLSNISDYIYWSDQVGLDLDASAEQIAQKIVEDAKNSVHESIHPSENEDRVSKDIDQMTTRRELSEPKQMIISYLMGDVTQKDFFMSVYTNNDLEEELSKETNLPLDENALCENLYLYLIDGDPSNHSFIRQAKELLLNYLEHNNINIDFFD